MSMTASSLFKSKIGMSMVEVLIAMAIMLFMALAMMQTALVVIDTNTKNAIRDEAVKIAEMQMADLRRWGFTKTPEMDAGTAMHNGWNALMIRNINVNSFYTRTVTIQNLPGGNYKRIVVRLAWTWKGEAFNHEIRTVRSSTE